MRDAGAVSATWDSEGRVSALTLGPDPSPSPMTTTQKKPTEEELRANNRRTLLASGSRLVPVGRGPKT